MARLDVPDGPGGEAALIWTLRPPLGDLVERMIRGAYQQSILPPAERFANDHGSIDDAFVGRLRESFTDPEVLDLTLCFEDR
jgi:hypothetical protein